MRFITTAATVAAIAVTGCSKVEGTTTAPPGAGTMPASTPAVAAEPRTEAAVRAAAGEEFDAYASGDYGATWDVWYAPAKKLISRADYTRLIKLCPDAAAGVRFNIEKITMDSDREAHVRVTRLVAIHTYRFVYEDGHWRFVPDDQAMRDYRTKTLKQMVTKVRAQGGCGDTS